MSAVRCHSAWWVSRTANLLSRGTGRNLGRMWRSGEQEGTSPSLPHHRTCGSAGGSVSGGHEGPRCGTPSERKYRPGFTPRLQRQLYLIDGFWCSALETHGRVAFLAVWLFASRRSKTTRGSPLLAAAVDFSLC